jgi:hypothetical protein
VPPAAAALPPFTLRADSLDSSVSQRTNMNGYRLRSWRLLNRGSRPESTVEMELVYDPIGWAALVKWLLPLSIAMVLLLLTPNLRASYGSERLAIPPVILLTLVFMQQAYRDSLPSLPYLTVLDSLYAFSYCVTLLMFCEFIWCANLMQRLEPARFAAIERRIDRLESRVDLSNQEVRSELAGMRDDVRRLEEENTGHVPLYRYLTVEKIVFGMVGFILLGFMTALIAVVVK